METAGKTLDDKELSDAMKESGLGTPATRAAIIEVLLKREYIVRRGKSLEATDKGVRLIEVVHPEVKSPAMTGQWEAYLKRIERGQAQLGPFLDRASRITSASGRQSRRAAALRRRAGATGASGTAPAQRPRRGSPAVTAVSGEHRSKLLHERFGFSNLPAQSGGGLPRRRSTAATSCS